MSPKPLSGSGSCRDSSRCCRWRNSCNACQAVLIIGSWKPTIIDFYNRLIKAGKPPKLALTACMRKILTWIRRYRNRSMDSTYRPGLSRLQGNWTLYRKLILKFADSCREGIAQIETAIESRNYREILQQAHSIKGSAGNLGAKGAQAAAMSLEHLVKNSPETTPPQDSLIKDFEKLSKAADVMFKSVETLDVGPGQTIPQDRVIIDCIPNEHRKKLAQRIKDAAEMGDITALVTVASELEKDFGSQQNYCKRLVEIADEFDLDGCAQLAKVLIEE